MTRGHDQILRAISACDWLKVERLLKRPHNTIPKLPTNGISRIRELAAVGGGAVPDDLYPDGWLR